MRCAAPSAGSRNPAASATKQSGRSWLDARRPANEPSVARDRHLGRGQRCSTWLDQFRSQGRHQNGQRVHAGAVLQTIIRPSGGESGLRVLEMCVSRGSGLEVVAIDLPLSWAHQMETARVVFRNTNSQDLGWHISLQDEGGWEAADFPWWDHADKLLLQKPAGWAPIEAEGERWFDLEQHWYVSVQADSRTACIFRADWDTLNTKGGLKDLVPRLHQPGRIEIGVIMASWSAVPLESFYAAWSTGAMDARRLKSSTS